MRCRQMLFPLMSCQCVCVCVFYWITVFRWLVLQQHYWQIYCKMSLQQMCYRSIWSSDPVLTRGISEQTTWAQFSVVSLPLCPAPTISMAGRWFLKRKKNRSKDSHQLNGSAFPRSLGSENRICYCQSWFWPFLNFSVCKCANPLGWKQLIHRRPNNRDGVNNNNKGNKSRVGARWCGDLH